MSKILFARSDFSLGESIVQPKQIPEMAKKHGYQACAIVDTMTISGMIDFSLACKSNEIKGLVGCRVRVVEDPLHRKPKKGDTHADKPNPEHYWDVYIKNDEGFQDLARLLSKAFSSEYFYFVPRVGLDDLIETLQRGNLCALSSDVFSAFSLDSYGDIADRLVASCGASTFALQLCPVSTPVFDRINERIVETAERHGLKIIANYPVNYLSDDQADSKDIYRIICNNEKVGDHWNRIPYVRDFSIHEPSFLIKKLAEFSKRTGVKVSSELIKNQDWLSESVEYEWHKQPISLPKMAENEFQTLKALCIRGWKDRLESEVFGYKPSSLLINTYKDILIKELRLLEQMGFSGYFLLVHDLVKWSKESGISVGPGRGSVGGSLVAYLIGITDVDPVRFGLIFERFINPERLDLPDADLDFMSSRRGEVIEYLTNKYGEDRVAGIANYTRLGAASALRDSARVHGLSNLEMSVTKLIPSDMNLAAAREADASIDQFAEAHEHIWNHAIQLEGSMRSYGRHAAGTIVAGRPLTDVSVVESRKEGERTINWDKRYCEDMGLVKLDVLGLSTLDVLNIAVEKIKSRHGKEIDLIKLPLDDEETLKSFSAGKTVAVFQFESSGMRDLLRNIAKGVGTLTFDHITAATALYRPGPMESGMLDDYVAIAKGFKSVTYEHPAMEGALKETNGIIIYQEQVMRVAQDIAGFSMAEADHLRKAISKKDPELMSSLKEQFVEGAAVGQIEVELEDGTKVVVHRKTKFRCDDGEMRTVEEAAALDIGIHITA